MNGDRYDYDWSDEDESERGVYPLTPRHESLGYALWLDRVKSKPITITHVDKCWCSAWKPMASFMCFSCAPEGRQSWDGGQNV